MIPALAALVLFPASPSIAERLAQGEVVIRSETVEGSDFPVATAQALIDAPPEKVWEVVSDCARNRDLIPSVLEADMEEDTGDAVRCRVTIDMPFPLEDLRSVTSAVHIVDPGVRWQRSWRLLEGTFTVNQGYWRLEPFGRNQTLATYHIDARPTVPLPGWLIGLIQNNKLPEMFLRLRQLV